MVIHKMGKIGSCVAPLHAWAGSCLAAGWKEGSSGKMGGMSSRKVVGDRDPPQTKSSDESVFFCCWGGSPPRPPCLCFISFTNLIHESVSLIMPHCIYNTEHFHAPIGTCYVNVKIEQPLQSVIPYASQLLQIIQYIHLCKIIFGL